MDKQSKTIMNYLSAIHPNIISVMEFRCLLETRDAHCISIYIPTKGGGRENNHNQGRIMLKDRLKQVRQELECYGLSETDAKKYVEPLEDMEDDKEFWRNQSDCLALFKAQDEVKIFALPIQSQPQAYVSDHYYLLPVMPLFNEYGEFYILSLNRQDVGFFEATEFSIFPIRIDDLVPERQDEAVGYDFRDTSLQYQSGQNGDGPAVFHEHNSSQDDQDAGLEKFFRTVDKGIQSFLGDKTGPLVLVCADHHFPLYKRITDYHNLWHSHIRETPREKDPLLIHKEAWLIVEPYFKQYKAEQTEKTRELQASGKVSIELDEIVPAAVDGRIETLFLRREIDRYGLYDMVNRSLIIDTELRPYHASLHNLVAVYTLLNDGKVYQPEKGNMPFEGTSINALYRY